MENDWMAKIAKFQVSRETVTVKCGVCGQVDIVSNTQKTHECSHCNHRISIEKLVLAQKAKGYSIAEDEVSKKPTKQDYFTMSTIFSNLLQNFKGEIPYNALISVCNSKGIVDLGFIDEIVEKLNKACILIHTTNKANEKILKFSRTSLPVKIGQLQIKKWEVVK